MSGSLKELSKCLVNLFSSGNSGVAANQEVLSIIDAYKEKHTPPSENDRARLQEELLAIYKRHVNGPKNPSFLHILGLLKHDFIIEPDQCTTWWDMMLYPLLDQSESLKQTMKDANKICLDILVFHQDDPDFKTRHAAAQVMKTRIFDAYFLAVSATRRSVSRDLEALLLSFAIRRTQDFFESIDVYFSDPKHRLQSLTLLSRFVRSQTQYIYQIYDTPLLKSLLLCLKHDASTTVVSLALTVFIMILPHIPDKLATMLPSCFQIFARLLCWDHLAAVQRRTAAMVKVEGAVETEDKAADSPQKALIENGWKTVDTSFDIAHSTPPKCAQFFTFMYGLYPLNFLQFLRCPSDVLAHMPDSARLTDDEIDDEVIRNRAEPLVRRHLLHPNLTSLTTETEVSDSRRWMKMEPSDVVILCISLDTVQIESSALSVLPGRDLNEDVALLDLDPGSPRSTSVADGEHSFSLDSTIQRSTSIATSGHGKAGNASRLASPAFLPTLKPEFRSGPVLQEPDNEKGFSTAADVLHLYAAIQALSTDHTSANLSSTANVADYKTIANEAQREVLLLSNELNYERHLKQQHLQHIGRLRRANVIDVAVETERQNLYNTTRALKAKVLNLEKTLRGLRNEVVTNKANRSQYEASLNDRIKRLREEKTALGVSRDSLERALEQANGDVANMRISLGIAEGLTLNLRQQLDVLKPEIQETKDLQKNFELLKQRIRDAEVQDIQLRLEKERVAAAQAEAKQSSLKFEALQNHLDAVQQRCDIDNEISSPAAGKTFNPSTSEITLAQAGTLQHMIALQALRATQHKSDTDKRYEEAREESRRLKMRVEQLEAEVQALTVSGEHATNLLTLRAEQWKSQSIPTGRSSLSSASSTRQPTTSTLAGNERMEPSRSPSIASFSPSVASFVHGSRRLDSVPASLAKGSSQSAPASPAQLLGPSKQRASPAPAKKEKENKVLGGRFRW